MLLSISRTGHVMTGICCFASMLASAVPAAAITVQTSADFARTLANGRFSGVGSIGQSNASQGSTFRHVCTGSLVAANVVLTATHCLGDGFKFSLPAAGDLNAGAPGEVYNIVNPYILPSYFDPTQKTDLAIFTLDRSTVGREIYGLYDQKDEIGQITTVVGAGMTGLLSSGVDVDVSDYKLRYGYNRFDATFSDFAERVYKLYGFDYRPSDGDDRLLYDYDNGLAENDSFGRYFGINDTGVRDEFGRLVEVGSVYGDSGGPDILAGKIAAVHSGLGAGAYLERTDATGCGTNGSSDFAPARPGGSCFDGSWGDFAISTRVSYYATPIRDYIASASVTVVPEPSTWAMMIVGFAAIGETLRRRQRRVAKAV